MRRQRRLPSLCAEMEMFSSATAASSAEAGVEEHMSTSGSGSSLEARQSLVTAVADRSRRRPTRVLCSCVDGCAREVV